METKKIIDINSIIEKNKEKFDFLSNVQKKSIRKLNELLEKNNLLPFLKDFKFLDLAWMIAVQYIFKFDNNYWASVIIAPYTYWWSEWYFELAVIYFKDEDKYILDYTTPITKDVLWYLLPESVIRYLKEIKNLKK